MGDPACFLHEICLSCGRYVGDEQADSDRCPHCDDPRTPGDEPPRRPQRAESPPGEWTA